MRKALAVLLIAAFSLIPVSVRANHLACADRDHIIESLATIFKQRVMVELVDGAGNLVEITADEKGTWTLIVTNPNKSKTCAIISGEGFEVLRPFSAPPVQPDLF